MAKEKNNKIIDDIMDYLQELNNNVLSNKKFSSYIDFVVKKN